MDVTALHKEHLFKRLDFEYRDESSVVERSDQFLELMKKRRSVREFSCRAVPKSVIENAIAVAGSAPSGANRQPWHFVAVSSTDIKKQIREAAEKEEREFYEHRATEAWLDALSPLQTDAHKPFLQVAPWLIAVFAQKYTLDKNGQKHKHYYTPESVGIAAGFLIASLHHAGLATLTHTPSPMGFLRSILGRPPHEKPYLLLVTGYPAEGAQVPDIHKKSLEDQTSWF